MKWYQGSDGSQRFWLDPGEIEQMMETELQKASLLPVVENLVIDIERFIERHLNAVLDQYADLDPTVLGVTEFRPGMSPIISINKDLTGSALDEDESPPGVLGRWRATLAHEAAHVVIHSVLFDAIPNQQALFSFTIHREKEAQRLLRCLKRDVTFGGRRGDWREVQANLGMAALLMPRSTFAAAAQEEIKRGRMSHPILAGGSKEANVLTACLARRFEVSRQAASIRLQTLGIIFSAAQEQFILWMDHR